LRQTRSVERREASIMAMPIQQEPPDPVAAQHEQDLGAHGPVSEQRIVLGPQWRGLGLLGLLIALTGAWGGIVPYVGPSFGYRANASGSFEWTMAHAMLYLVPGAVALGLGLIVLLTLLAPGGGSGIRAISALGVVACGAWFVLGPEAWLIFSHSVVFGPGTGALARFTNEVGYNLGPGLLLAVLGTVVLARPGALGYVIRPPEVPSTAIRQG
jgi:hypothetical protein